MLHPILPLEEELAKRKQEAVAHHTSQELRFRAKRERGQTYEEFEADIGRDIGYQGRIEAFELVAKAGDILGRMLINRSVHPFHLAWNGLFASSSVQGVTICCSSGVYKGQKRHASSSNAEKIGVDSMKDALERFYPVMKIGFSRKMTRSEFDRRDIRRAFKSVTRERMCLLVGGAKSNRFVSELYNNFSGVHWKIKCEEPSTDAFLSDGRGRRYIIDYVQDKSGRVALDYGVVSFMKNPCAEETPLVYIAGCTGLATKAGTDVFCNPWKFELDFASIVEKAMHGEIVELPFSYNSARDEITFLRKEVQQG